MGIKCSQCNNNWSELEKQDDDANDESYEACPICCTDTHLTYEPDDKDKLVWMPVSGGLPVPVGHTSINAYREWQYLIWLEETGKTKEQHEAEHVATLKARVQATIKSRDDIAKKMQEIEARRLAVEERIIEAQLNKS